MDGTLIEMEWVDHVWGVALPTLYGLENNINLKKAQRILQEEYDRVGSENTNWYKLEYWFDKFNLKKNYRELLSENRDRIKMYGDAKSVLKKLSEKMKTIIITTNASREFIEFELPIIERCGAISKIYSSVSDFQLIKKDVRFYEQVCADLKKRGIIEKNSDVVHIGDDLEADFVVPRSIGITAIYLNRKEKDLNQKEKDLDSKEKDLDSKEKDLEEIIDDLIN